MLLFRVSDSAVGGREEGEPTRPMTKSPGPKGAQGGNGAASTALSPMTIDGEAQQEGVLWPQVPEANATLQVPSFAKTEAREGRGGPTCPKKTDSGDSSRETRSG